MKYIKGQYTDAKVFTDNVEETALSQIKEMCNQDFMEGSKVRVMPDVHAGKGCTIGTTMTIKDKVVPNLVGVDVGCGLLTVPLLDKEIDFDRLDNAIRNTFLWDLKYMRKSKINQRLKQRISRQVMLYLRID